MGGSTFWIITIVFCIAVYFLDKFLRKKIEYAQGWFLGI